MTPALSYLAASGAVVIGPYWVAKEHKRTLVRAAQTLIDSGYPADVALVAAAKLCHVTLTPNDVAIERAAQASAQLDEYLQGGLLRIFNVQYAQRRKAGEVRMCYTAARARFRGALIRRLAKLGGAGLDNGTNNRLDSLIEEALSV